MLFRSAIQRRPLGADAGEPLVLPLCPVSLGLPLFQGAVLNQSPFALVLGCSDARVPTELVFDQWLNDLFVLRVAGNVLGTACLGSLHYAARHLGESLKLVVVLGHSKCGAVQAAVATYLSPQNFSDIAYTFALRTLVDQIQIAIRGSAHALRDVAGHSIAQDPDYESLLVTTSVYVNAAVSALELRRELDQRGFEQPVVTGVYEFETLSVQALRGHRVPSPIPPVGCGQGLRAPTSSANTPTRWPRLPYAPGNCPDERKVPDPAANSPPPSSAESPGTAPHRGSGPGGRSAKP